jgi:hypothetical protein
MCVCVCVCVRSVLALCEFHWPFGLPMQLHRQCVNMYVQIRKTHIYLHYLLPSLRLHSVMFDLFIERLYLLCVTSLNNGALQHDLIEDLLDVFAVFMHVCMYM